jgi:hypothetical protein
MRWAIPVGYERRKKKMGGEIDDRVGFYDYTFRHEQNDLLWREDEG